MTVPNLPTDELLSAYLDGELAVAERAEVERHLAANAELRQALADLQALRTTLRALPAVRPDAGFQARVMQAVAAAQAKDAATKRGGAAVVSPAGNTSWQAPFVGILAAAGVAAGLALLLAGPWYGPAEVALDAEPARPPHFAEGAPPARPPAAPSQAEAQHLPLPPEHMVRGKADAAASSDLEARKALAAAPADELAAAPFAVPLESPGAPQPPLTAKRFAPADKPDARLQADALPAPPAGAAPGAAAPRANYALNRALPAEKKEQAPAWIAITVEAGTEDYRFAELASTLQAARIDVATIEAPAQLRDRSVERAEIARSVAQEREQLRRAADGDAGKAEAEVLDVIYLEGPAGQIAAALEAWQRSAAGRRSDGAALAALRRKARGEVDGFGGAGNAGGERQALAEAGPPAIPPPQPLAAPAAAPAGAAPAGAPLAGREAPFEAFGAVPSDPVAPPVAAARTAPPRAWAWRVPPAARESTAEEKQQLALPRASQAAAEEDAANGRTLKAAAAPPTLPPDWVRVQLIIRPKRP